jgi:digeranylgeranylglycerophospholipid reductase
MSIKCDVLVVGGGPAGSSAARSAAMNGAKTIFIDKKEKVGVPVQCAEGIGKYLFPYLPFKIPKEQLIWKIEGMFFWADDISIERSGAPWDGYSIDRSMFDKWLSLKAISKGAELRTNTKLIDLKFDDEKFVSKAIVQKDNKKIEITPKIIIAADGVDSTVLECLNIKNIKRGDIGKVKSYEMKNLDLTYPHYEQFYFGDFAPRAYAYIFPKSKSVANVGVGTTTEENIDAYFDKFIACDQVRKQLKNGEIVSEKSGEAPIRYICDKWIYGNIILTGDAANQNIKPYIEGILPSIITGHYAGEIASSCIQNGRIPNENNYRLCINKKLGKLFKISDEMIDLVYNLPFGIEDKITHLIYLGIFSGIFTNRELASLDKFDYYSLKKLIINRKNNL